MSIEFYRDLLIVQSLEYKMKQHLSAIEEQDKRWQFLEKQILMRREESEHAELTLKDLQIKIQNCDLEHQQLEKRVARLTEDSKSTEAKQVDDLEKEIQSANERIKGLELTLYEMMNREEECQLRLKDHHNFLKGSAKSLEQLAAEIKQIKEKEQNEIVQLQERVDNFLNNMPAMFKTAYLQANKKNRFKSPLSFLEKQYCETCQFQLDRLSAQEVEEGRIIHHCQGCQRLLIPLNAR
jgi:predicted  nucleic acid-binding Zn-ribbon protein